MGNGSEFRVQNFKLKTSSWIHDSGFRIHAFVPACALLAAGRHDSQFTVYHLLFEIKIRQGEEGFKRE
jgi:hypothetical protein